MPTIHSDPGSGKKFDDITKITPISTDWPALPSALILGSGSVLTSVSSENGFSIFRFLLIYDVTLLAIHSPLQGSFQIVKASFSALSHLLISLL